VKKVGWAGFHGMIEKGVIAHKSLVEGAPVNFWNGVKNTLG